MKSIVKSGGYKLTVESRKRAKEINQLHTEISALLFQSLQRAIRIGELLTAEKTEQGYGGFTKWCKDSLPFSDRTARRYIEVYENKEHLLTQGIQDATEAYRLLKSTRTLENEDQTLDIVSKVETVITSNDAVSEPIEVVNNDEVFTIKLTTREQQLVAAIVAAGGDKKSAEYGIKTEKFRAKKERERKQKERKQQSQKKAELHFKNIEVPPQVYRRFSRLSKQTGRPIVELLTDAADALTRKKKGN